ncbi:MAG: DUF5666 domain-containing protein [Lysobacterales bacterium]
MAKNRWLSALCLLTMVLSAFAPGLAAQEMINLRLNGRPVTLPVETPVLIDQVPGTLADLRGYPDGLQMEWTRQLGPQKGLGNPVFSFRLIGPVTSTTPLRVLGQSITVNGDTVLAGVGPDLNLPVNTPVVVAGLLDPNGSVLATLIERRGQFGQTFLLSGPVQAIDANQSQVLVGSQWVSYAGVSFILCTEPLPQVGEFLAVRAQAQPDFQPGTVLTQVISGYCLTPVPPGTAGASGMLEGIITQVVDANHFRIGSLQVLVSTVTQFVFGGRDELAVGMPVIVEGSYIDAQEFDAAVIEYVRPVVRFQVPVTPAQVTPGVSISPYDLLVRASPQARDEDLILANGLTQSRQVEVRGYIDGLGRLYATRVRDRGNPNNNAVRLRGPVQTIADPLLTIQGLTVDTTGVNIFDEFGVFMTRPQFFAALQLNDLVDFSGASYNPATRTLSGGTMVYIGAEPLPPPLPERGNLPFINNGTVSGYSDSTPLFRDGFEG